MRAIGSVFVALILAGCEDPNKIDAAAMAEQGRAERADCHHQAAVIMALNDPATAAGRARRREADHLCVEGDVIQNAVEGIAQNQAGARPNPQ